MTLSTYGLGAYGLGPYGIGGAERQCDYRLSIGFGGGIGGRFTIGTSMVGGTDIIATDWTEFFNGPYDDVTDDVAEHSLVACSRGLDAKLAGTESGKSNFTLIKAQNISFYDPNEPTSPLNNGTTSPGFVPMRPVRLVASNDGWVTTQGVFYHFIRTAQYNPETGLCSIQAEDLFFWMNRVDNPQISPVSGITSSQAVGLLLDSIGFTDPAFRNLSTTPSITNITFSADGTKTVLQLLKEILDAEQGRAFIDRNGVFHFEDRYARERRAVATASFTTELFAVDSRADADTVGNRVTVTGAVGGPQVAQDATSIHNFGVGDIGSVSSAYIPDGPTAAALAALILMRIKDPHPPQQGTIDNDTAATMSAQLALELQDRVTISGTDGYVERIEHTLAPGGVRQTTTLTMSQVAQFAPFQIGVSTLVAPAATTGDYIAA